MLDYGIVAYLSERPGLRGKCISRQKLCIIRYEPEPVPHQKISPADLDPSKEIRFTGGNFRSMNYWRKNWFGGKMESRLELNTVQGIAPFLEGTDYWAVCTPSMANSIAKTVSLQIYELEDCPDTWDLFFLKRGNEGDGKLTAAEVFEQALFAYVRDFQSFIPM